MFLLLKKTKVSFGCFVFAFLWGLFETMSVYVAQAGFKLSVILPRVRITAMHYSSQIHIELSELILHVAKVFVYLYLLCTFWVATN